VARILAAEQMIEVPKVVAPKAAEVGMQHIQALAAVQARCQRHPQDEGHIVLAGMPAAQPPEYPPNHHTVILAALYPLLAAAASLAPLMLPAMVVEQQNHRLVYYFPKMKPS
jgi:hypothetical protein